MLMIRPHFAARITGRTARAQSIEPVTLTRITASHSSSAMSSKPLRPEQGRVVDQHVDPPEGVERRRGHRPGRVRIGHVGGDRDGAPALGRDLGGHRFGVAAVEVADQHRGAGAGEFERVFPPDSLPGAGDDHPAPAHVGRIGAAAARRRRFSLFRHLFRQLSLPPAIAAAS